MKDTVWERIIKYGLEYLGLYYSSYRAFVVNNQDPLKLGRVQLLIPHINPTQTDPTWAWPKGVYGGKNYGIHLIPQPTDMVWVEFEHGNPDFPLWSHAGYAKGELPPEFENTKHYGFKTPSGTLIKINDNKGQEEVFIKLNNQDEWVKVIKEELEIEAKLIKLGKNGDEQGVLGNTLQKKMDKVVDKMDDILSTLITHKHASPNTPPTPDDITKFTKYKVELGNIKKEFKEYLSEKIKIDK